MSTGTVQPYICMILHTKPADLQNADLQNADLQNADLQNLH